MMAFGQEIGGPTKAQAMLNGQGVSLILKSFEINFRRPVTFPDNVRANLILLYCVAHII